MLVGDVQVLLHQRLRAEATPRLTLVEADVAALDVDRRGLFAGAGAMRNGIRPAAHLRARGLERELVAKQVAQQRLRPLLARDGGASVGRVESGGAALEDVPVVLRVAPCASDLVGKPGGWSQSKVFCLLSWLLFLGDAVKQIERNQRTFGADAYVLAHRAPPGTST